MLVHPLRKSLFSAQAAYHLGRWEGQKGTLAKANSSQQIQASRECLEISVPGNEGNIGVHAALCDQGVAKPSFPFLSENLGAKSSGTVPESVLQRHQREFEESLCY